MEKEKLKTSGEMAVVYARYSSSRQQETSIEGQLAAARQYAEAKGYTIIREYCDRARTGTNDNREAFQEMLSDCSKHQFTVIIVWKVDRFGRNREEITFNKYRAKKQGVRVEYVAENLSDGPESVILESVLEGMAEYYSLQLAQNTKRGLLEAAKKHHVINGSSLTFGYRAAEDKTYEADPDTAPIVKRIFEMYADGYRESEIIRWLNESGIRTKKGNTWKRGSLMKMLKNERYIGTYIYKDIIRDENAIPALVSREVFEKVQKMLKVNRRMPSHSWCYTDYILTGKLYCGLCGSQMAGVSGNGHCGNKYMYYACMNHFKKQGCTKRNIRQDAIEPLVLDAVYSLLDDPALVSFIADKTWECYKSQDQSAAEQKALEAQLAGVEKSLGNLIKTIEAGVFNDMIQKRMEELEGQRTALKKALAERELEKPFELTKDFVRFALEKYRDMDRNSRETQRKLIDVFINAVYVYDDRITIAYNYTDGNGSSRTVTLDDMKKAHPSPGNPGFECADSSSPMRARFEPQGRLFYWSSGIFAENIKIPGGS